jgi:hypothetical protein
MALSANVSQDIVDLPVEQLLLDKENPRLASSLVDQPTQEDLLRVLWTEMAVDEVALSIAANGYYRDEALLVIPEKDSGAPSKGRYIVVEGNRRLGAVLLLRDSALRDRIKATSLPTITETDRRALDRLPAFIHSDRESIWAYVGFRHVNGTKPWDAFSKARYVARVHEEFHVPLGEIAGRIGDKHSTVLRLYSGYKVLRQAEDMAGFDKEDRVRNRFYFSHLYTAVDYPEFRSFLGITEERAKRRDPVPKSKLDDLAELMVWLYGRKSTSTEPVVRTQSPDLNRLRTIIGKPSSLSLLRRGYLLDAAFEHSKGDPRRFREALFAAKEELQKAKATVTTGYNGEEDLLDTMEGLVATGQSVLDEMRTKRETASGRRKAS